MKEFLQNLSTYKSAPEQRTKPFKSMMRSVSASQGMNDTQLEVYSSVTGGGGCSLTKSVNYGCIFCPAFRVQGYFKKKLNSNLILKA
jgi:hypothetical protein